MYDIKTCIKTKNNMREIIIFRINTIYPFFIKIMYKN